MDWDNFSNTKVYTGSDIVLFRGMYWIKKIPYISDKTETTIIPAELSDLNGLLLFPPATATLLMQPKSRDDESEPKSHL
jgi:hypothetical protein